MKRLPIAPIALGVLLLPSLSQAHLGVGPLPLEPLFRADCGIVGSAEWAGDRPTVDDDVMITLPKAAPFEVGKSEDSV